VTDADETAGQEAGSTAEKAVLRNVRSLLRRRRETDDVDLNSDLYADLELDSLEVAELAVALEDELGNDPYSAGLDPKTVGEVVEFYDK
jgi:acyl carrier protein